MKLFTVAAFAALAMSNASCPNMCSGNGNCKNDDMCECHRNWMAADCSERVCPYDWAFVTTPQGDLNMDGDIYDSMQYAKSTHYDDARTITAAESKTNLLTIQQPGGDWEMWPSYGNVRSSAVTDASADTDEAHFYMECSNRGLCDRKTGECECFDGYEGSACRRTVCANGCSGHGTCESVTALTGGTDYKLWDGDKSMSCKCDPGYGAADCSERQCPTGDDPLTTKTVGNTYDQKNEMVYIDVTDADNTIAGFIQLQYSDDFGETWWSNYIKVRAEGTDNAGQISDIEAGFTSIPNGVFPAVTSTISTITNGWRVAVNFTDNPGNLDDFTCVTVDRFSNTEQTITQASCAISSRPAFTETINIAAGGIGPFTASGDLSGSLSMGNRIDIDGVTNTIATISGTDITVITSISANVGNTAVSLAHNMDGTTERAECSNRGLCDYESGTCQCFQGYTGDNCGKQSTLAW